MTTNINNSPKYACRTCMKQQCGCKDTESALPCHFYTERPKQEPVGYFAYDEEHNIWEELTRPDAPGATPLYAAPVQQVTRADLKAAFKEGFERAADLYAPKDVPEGSPDEPVKQEPVAWWFQPPNKNVRPMFDTQQHGGKWQPLYAAPVRTKDLTDDEILKAFGITGCVPTTKERVLKDARAVIAADREKNK